MTAAVSAFAAWVAMARAATAPPASRSLVRARGMSCSSRERGVGAGFATAPRRWIGDHATRQLKARPRPSRAVASLDGLITPNVPAIRTTSAEIVRTDYDRNTIGWL